jgi:hypothetical protein
MFKRNMNNPSFKKKVYRKLDASPLSGNIIPTMQSSKEPPKKIVPSTEGMGLREKFKKTFLPLLIEVFELRQMIDNYELGAMKTVEKSPEEIINHLEELQKNIEEIERWSEGVSSQIKKGLEAAREIFGEKGESPIKRLLRRIKR